MRIVKKHYPEEYNGIFFEKKSLQERYNLLINFEGLEIFDAEHAIERFEERFPQLSIDRFYDTLKKGLRKIHKTEDWGYEQNQYVIISRKYKIKVPIHIRPDRFHPEILIGVIGTILHSDKNPYNKYEEIQILVEQSKKDKSFEMFSEFTEKEVGSIDSKWFNHYLEEGEYYREFSYIEVD